MARHIGRHNKQLRQTTDLDLVATIGDVAVYRKPVHDPASPWRGYYLRDDSPDKRVKRAYHLGYNGRRFAEGRDAATLDECRTDLLLELYIVIGNDYRAPVENSR